MSTLWSSKSDPKPYFIFTSVLNLQIAKLISCGFLGSASDVGFKIKVSSAFVGFWSVTVRRIWRTPTFKVIQEDIYCQKEKENRNSFTKYHDVADALRMETYRLNSPAVRPTNDDWVSLGSSGWRWHQTRGRAWSCRWCHETLGRDPDNDWHVDDA